MHLASTPGRARTQRQKSSNQDENIRHELVTSIITVRRTRPHQERSDRSASGSIYCAQNHFIPNDFLVCSFWFRRMLSAPEHTAVLTHETTKAEAAKARPPPVHLRPPRLSASSDAFGMAAGPDRLLGLLGTVSLPEAHLRFEHDLPGHWSYMSHLSLTDRGRSPNWAAVSWRSAGLLHRPGTGG